MPVTNASNNRQNEVVGAGLTSVPNGRRDPSTVLLRTAALHRCDRRSRILFEPVHLPLDTDDVLADYLVKQCLCFAIDAFDQMDRTVVQIDRTVEGRVLFVWYHYM